MAYKIDYKIAYLILASGKSRRLPNKNILEIKGKPLIKYTIDFVNKIDVLKKTYIVTDCEEIEKIATRNYVKCIMEDRHSRERNHENGMRLMRWIHEQIGAEIYVLLPPTSPVRDDEIFFKAYLDFMFSAYDSAASVYRKSRTEYILNGSFWFYRSEQLKKNDLIDEQTKLYIDKYNIDIDDMEMLRSFEEHLENEDKTNT